MKRTLLALALLATGYLAGTLAPVAQADTGLAAVVTELRNIRMELRDLRGALSRR
jgi:hypothetical protein